MLEKSKINKRVVAMPTIAEVTNFRYYTLMWRVISNLDISSRKWLENISLLPCQDFTLIDVTGEEIPFPEVDQIFKKWSERWISHYKEAADDSMQSPRRQCRHIKRLQLLWLYVRLYHGEKDRAVRMVL